MRFTGTVVPRGSPVLRNAASHDEDRVVDPFLYSSWFGSLVTRVSCEPTPGAAQECDLEVEAR